jgi:hypothetical protein
VDKALTALAVYDIGKPLVVGEIFPLSCTLEELDQFIDGASDRVDGWISHYFGYSIEEHAAGAKPGGKPVAEFLQYWREKGAQQAEHRKPQITIQTDDIGCIACRTGDVVELLIYRHLATRGNGNPVQVQVVLDGKTLAGKQWTVTQGSLIDREHSGFAHEQAADMEQARQELGEDASALAVAMRVMPRHREKYEKMSQLSQLETLPELSQDDTGRIRFDVLLSGHHVVHLRLCPSSSSSNSHCSTDR